MLRRALFLLLLYAAATGCRGSHVSGGGAPGIAPVMISLVESEPAETTLDRPDILDAPAVWLEMIDRAKSTLDFAEFYASEAEPQWRASSKLTPIIDAVIRAAARGVKVRFLADAKFAKQYPETLERFAAAKVDVRRIDVESLSGGVLHAKYFIADGFASYIGSQNFDWRALDHIQEMGVRFYSTELTSQLANVFETDWALAGGAAREARVQTHPPMRNLHGIEARTVSLVASPKGWLPDEGAWELPRIVALLDGAKHSIALQVLTYKTKDRSGQPFTTLDDAIRRAAARGVKVRILVGEWGAKGDAGRAVQDLSNLAEVRVISIPKWSGGDIPFARIAHAKYLVVDGDQTWIGTSNWEGDYFTRSRNVGVIALGGDVPTRLARYFDENWSSRYAAPLAAPAPAPPLMPPATPSASAPPAP